MQFRVKSPFRNRASAVGRFGVITLGLAVAGASWAAAAAGFHEVRLDNGLRVILSESPGSSLIASTVFVRAGAMRETEELNGAAHFLEHLLFNGTTSRTQQQLYDDVDMLGAYNNATTQKDFAVFLLVVGRESIRDGLEIQADMLFNSILPADKFEKERGIVIEELGKDTDDPDYVTGLAMDSVLYEGTAYARPILGTVASIEALPRDRVMEYYQTYYVPSNMTLLVMGDFESDEMLRLIEGSFGAVQTLSVPPDPETLPPPEGGRVVHHPTEGMDRHLAIRIPGPMPGDPSYIPLDLLGEVLARGAGSRLGQACDLEPPLRVKDLAAGITLVGGRAFFDVTASFGSDVDSDSLTRRLLGELVRLTAEDVSMLELAAARVSKRTEEVGLRQQIHYYSFMRGGVITRAPSGFLDAQMARYRDATIEDLRAAAEQWFRDPPFRVVVVGPGLTARDEIVTAADAGFIPPKQALPEESAEACEISVLDPFPAPRTAVALPPKMLALDSGMRVVFSSNPSSEVLALHLMALGRSYREPEGKEGITDFLHRMLPRGAGEWSEAALGSKLDAIGATVKVTDSPWIPYDDYYTVPEFSFVRFETLDDFYERALELLGLMVREPRFEDSEIETVRQEMLDLIAKRDASASGVARSLFREAIYGAGHAGAKDVLGTTESISSITREDLRKHHRRYFSPSNLVLTIVTGLPEEVMVPVVERAFSVSPEMLASPPEPWSVGMAQPRRVDPVPRIERELGKQQAEIQLGCLFDFDPADEAAIQVADFVLSDRMAFQLRERQGLAYTIGAVFSSWGTRGVLSAGMGTRPENLPVAEAGIVAQIDSLKTLAIDEKDVRKAVNARVGRMRMRRLSRMGQAYYLSMDLLHQKPLLAHETLLRGMRDVTPSDVMRVAQEYFGTEQLACVIVR